MKYLLPLSVAISPVALGFFLNRAFTAQNKKLEVIHVLVNSRLDESLKEIRELKAALAVERAK